MPIRMTPGPSRGSASVPTYTIAAYNASRFSRENADWVCDGAADNVDIKAAIDSLPAGGGRIVFTEGTFYITGLVTTSKPVILSGQGYATVFTQPNVTNLANFFYFDGDYVTFRDFLIDGNSANQTTGTHLLRMHSVTWGVVDHVSFLNQEGTNSSIAITGTSEAVTVNNCFFKSCGPVGTASGGAPTVERLVVTNSHFVDDTSSSIGGSAQYFVIANNTIENSNTSGTGAIDIAASVDCIIANNIIHNGLALIYTQGASGRVSIHHNVITKDDADAASGIQAIAPSGSTDSLIIDHNILLNCGTTSHGAIRVGREAGPHWGYTIIDHNRIRGSRGHGIEVDDSDRPIISHNQVIDSSQDTNNTYDGIILTGTVTTPILDYNRVEETASNKARYSINISGTGVNGARLRGNVLVAAATGAVNDAGTGTVSDDNSGWVTENSGTATVLNGTTSIAVTHGLATTPTVDDIWVVPSNNPTNDPGWFWVDTITATQFTINVRADPGATGASFGWHARIL